MDVSKYKNKKVAILGLSTEGTDATKFFVSAGADVTCCDRRSQEELGELYSRLASYPVKFQLGNSYLKNLSSFDLVIRTPGMALFLPELVRAQSLGINISSLTKVFFDMCEAPIIGVTGTKGKGTTTTLIGEILKLSGFTVHVGGNVGTALLSQVQQIRPSDKVVLELSSFQLEDLHKSPHIAVVLNITSDHLGNADPLSTNYHLSNEKYIAAKKAIVRFQKNTDFAVINADYETSRSFSKETVAQVFYFSTREKVVGTYVEQGKIIRTIGATQEFICETKDLQLRGAHNWENITAAITASSLLGATLTAIKNTVPNFKGLEHRLEFVAEREGVKYYNDSFSTTPETAIAALKAFYEPIILIAGGSEKNSDFEKLGEQIIKSKLKALLLIGDTASRIEMAVRKAAQIHKIEIKFPIIRDIKTMKEIVALAKSYSKVGDVVLLSPACASFGLFKNYKDRGYQFKQYVRSLD